jgi:hypothetical protein
MTDRDVSIRDDSDQTARSLAADYRQHSDVLILHHLRGFLDRRIRSDVHRIGSHDFLGFHPGALRCVALGECRERNEHAGVSS